MKAEPMEPEAVAEALERIGQIYQIEAQIREQNLRGEKKLKIRSEQSLPASQANITTQYLGTVFRHPHQMVLAIPYRTATIFVILHPDSLSSIA